MLSDVWQHEFDVLRSERPSRWAQLVSRRLLFAPRWMPLRLVGGAMTCQHWVVISREVLDAPAYTRRYLLAHEWGHVRCGHVALGFASQILVVVPILVGRPRSLVTGAALLVFLLLWVGRFFWATGERREWEADADAARWIGPADALAGRDWVASFVGGTGGRRRERRRTALERLAEEEGAAGPGGAPRKDPPGSARWSP